MNIINNIGRISCVILIILKSIWNATINIVWGMATVFLLGGLLLYFNVNTAPIDSLLELTKLLMNNWVLFWWVFFSIEFYPELNKIYNKDE
jgi:hypothetical protein